MVCGLYLALASASLSTSSKSTYSGWLTDSASLNSFRVSVMAEIRVAKVFCRLPYIYVYIHYVAGMQCSVCMYTVLYVINKKI